MPQERKIPAKREWHLTHEEMLEAVTDYMHKTGRALELSNKARFFQHRAMGWFVLRDEEVDDGKG